MGTFRFGPGLADLDLSVDGGDAVLDWLEGHVPGFDRFRDATFEGARLVDLAARLREALADRRMRAARAVLAELGLTALPEWAEPLVAARLGPEFEGMAVLAERAAAGPVRFLSD
jgi:hypothetical protein